MEENTGTVTDMDMNLKQKKNNLSSDTNDIKTH